MDYINHNTTLRTNKHLNLEERFYVEKSIAAGDSVTAIATVLGRSRTTIYTELKRGSVVQIRQGKACLVYLADSGQLTYEQQRLGSFNTMKLGFIEFFILWIEKKYVKNIGPLMLLSDMLNVIVYLHVMKWFVLKLYITIFIKDYLG